MKKLFIPATLPASKEATLEPALELTRLLYLLFNKKYFVGVTGGLVYKDGPRKDIDILIYRNRAAPTFEVEEILELLYRAGLTDIKTFGFVTKAKWRGYDIDILHPESECKDIYG